MRSSTVALFLGFFVLLVSISSSEGGRGGKGKGGGRGRWCKDELNMDVDKAIMDKCKPPAPTPAPDGVDGDDSAEDDGKNGQKGDDGKKGGKGKRGGGGGGGGGKGKWGGKGGRGGRGGMGKRMMCMWKEKQIIQNDKFNLDKYKESVEKMFKTPAKATIANDEFKKCYDDDDLASKSFADEASIRPLMKCSFMGMKKACKKDKKKDKDAGDDSDA